MKVELKFNFDLDLEEDREKFEEISQDRGAKLKMAMWNFSQDTLRKYRKYGCTLIDFGVQQSDTREEVCQKVVEKLEERFYEALRDEEASID